MIETPLNPGKIAFERQNKKDVFLGTEKVHVLSEPRREKTGLLCFRPGLTKTGVYSHRSRLEA